MLPPTEIFTPPCKLILACPLMFLHIQVTSHPQNLACFHNCNSLPLRWPWPPLPWSLCRGPSCRPLTRPFLTRRDVPRPVHKRHAPRLRGAPECALRDGRGGALASAHVALVPTQRAQQRHSGPGLAHLPGLGRPAAALARHPARRLRAQPAGQR